MLDAKVRVLRKKDKPFATNGFSKLFPRVKLFGKKGTMTYKSCAIISSAGSLTKSGLGHFIGKFSFLSDTLLIEIQRMFSKRTAI